MLTSSQIYSEETTINDAIKDGNILLLKKLINNDAELEKDAIHLSIIYYSDSTIEIIKALVEYGADINAKTLGHGYALHTACSARTNRYDVVSLLIELGADINKLASNDDNALRMAAQKGYEDVVKLLIDNGIDNSYYNSALISGTRNIEIIKTLISKGVDVKEIDAPIVYYSIKNENYEVTKILLENGADPNMPIEYNQETPIMLAVAKNNSDVTHLLLKNDVDINQVSEMSGKTLLMIAIEADSSDVINLLIDKGISVNALDNHSRTALDYAMITKNVNIAKILILKEVTHFSAKFFHNKDEEMLFVAVTVGDIQKVKELAGKGVNLEKFSDSNFNPPIVTAAQQGNVEIVEFLLNNGVKPDVTGNYKATALIVAAMEIELEQFKIIELLVNAGANLDFRTDEGGTALMILASKCYFPYSYDAMNLLIKSGADVNLSTDNGYTAIKLTIKNNCVEGFKALKAAGAK